MRRKTGHIRQRSAESWELRYSLGTNAATGRRRVATITVRGTRRDAERELRRVLRSIDTGEHVDPTRMTLGKWLEEWLLSIRDEISPKSLERYSEIVGNFLTPELGAISLSKLTPTHIQTAYSKWSSGGRRDGKSGGLAPATRRYIHRILRSALARAVEQQIVVRNPADAFRHRLPKVEHKEMVALTAAQTARLIAALQGSSIYWPVLLAVATGARRGECLALRWRHVNLERGDVRIIESLEQTKAGLRFKAPKNEKPRSVVLPKFMVDQLRTFKTAQAEKLLALGIRQTSDTLVCCSDEGRPIQPRTLTHAFGRRVSKLKDMPRLTFHGLRHGHATALLESGVHPKIVQERLGHSSINVTLDIYSHVTETMQGDAASRLDDALGHAISGALASK